MCRSGGICDNPELQGRELIAGKASGTGSVSYQYLMLLFFLFDILCRIFIIKEMTMSATQKNKSPEIAQEALNPVQKKRAKIQQMVLDAMTKLDPSGDNTRRWQGFFSKLDDKHFDTFMKNLANKKVAMNIIMPNLKKPLKIKDLLEAAKTVNLTLSHRLWMPDRTRPGKKYLTNEKYLVLTLPVRRAQQEWDKKLSVPSRDRKIDALTGQVSGEDDACSISAPEIQSLNVRGLHNVLSEIVRVRGGDVAAYGDMNRQLQENGEARLDSLDPRTRARAGTIAHILLEGMMIENNL